MRAYLWISGIIFGIISLLHAARLTWDWPAEIAGWAVPLWLSWIAFVATGALCAWAVKLLR